jgi:hypothetical protein
LAAAEAREAVAFVSSRRLAGVRALTWPKLMEVARGRARIAIGPQLWR